MTRIFVAGFHHETNTFAPSFADWEAFCAGSGYPAYSRGTPMLEQMAPTQTALGGFAELAAQCGWALVPSVWAGAMPSNRVTTQAFERIAGEIVEDLRRGGFDAVFLDLHGAAVAQGADDAEGELLERVRAVVGSEMPIVASLDLHANVTARMLRCATAMTAYRTYPHVDMRETGQRAARLLQARLAAQAPASFTHALRVPFLLALNVQCTLLQPAASVIQEIVHLEAAGDVTLNFAMGFAAADFTECGPVVFGHGTDPQAVRAAVESLHRQVCVHHRAAWRLDLRTPDAAVEEGIAAALAGVGPAVIADTQDNPGAGGDANTTGMLHALLRAGAGVRLPGGVALGLVWDPQSARAACEAGVGATVALTLGRAVPTWSGALTDAAVPVLARVCAVSDGHVPMHGPMTAGVTMRLGACACVQVDGIFVLLASAKAQMLDLDLFRFLGVEPRDMKLLVVKSSVHFRAAFASLACSILVAKAPGPVAADPSELPWTQLPAGMATRP